MKEAQMFTSVEGIYRGGKVELTELPANIDDDTPVIVTFLAGRYADLGSRGVSQRMALELRERLIGFAEDWDSPEMEIYDHYDETKPNP
jgi:hypothetical protein